MREAPLRGIAFWLVIVFIVWMIHWNVQNVLWTSALTALLLWSQADFFLVTRFQIDEDGVTLSRGANKRMLEWNQVRSIKDQGNGLLLSPYRSNRMLENLRGVKLYYRNNRDDIHELVRNYCEVEFALEGKS